MASLSHRSGTFTRIAAAAAAVLLLPFAGVVTAHASPNPIGLSMTAIPTSVAPGSTLSYTITASNSEPQVANARLSDQLTGLKNVVLTSSRGYCTEQSLLVTCSGGDLPGQGSTWVVTITGIVTAGSGTVLSNTATFAANWSAQNTSQDYLVNATTNVTVGSPAPGALADLSTSLSGPSTSAPGANADYTLTVLNQGFVNASDVLVTGTVPPGFTLQAGRLVTGTSLFVCSAAALPDYSCTGGSLNSGANATISLPLKVSSTSPGAGVLTYKLTAVVDPQNAIPEPDDLQSNTNNFSQIVTTVPASPPAAGQVTLTKKASSLIDPTGSQVRIGDLLTYTVTAKSTSTRDTATRLLISDGTQGLDQASVTAKASDARLPCVNSNNLVTCQAGGNGYTLGVGASVSVTITGRVVQPPASIITNTATLQTLQSKVAITRTASVTTIVRPPIDLSVTQFSTCASKALLPAGLPGGCQPFRARNQFDYLITVGNSGLDDTNGVTLRAPLPADVVYEGFDNVAPSAGWACSESGSAPVVVTCTGGTVPGQLSSGTYGGTIRQVRLHLTAPNATGPITSTVYVDPFNAIAESDETNNTASTATQVDTGVNLTIGQKLRCPRQATVTDICDPVAPSGTVVYDLLVQNLGTQDATGITVSDVLPTGTRFRSAKEINGAVFGLPYAPVHNVACSASGARVTCTGGRLSGIYAAYGGPKLPNPTGKVPDGFTIEITAFAPAPYGPGDSPGATGSPILNQAIVDPDLTVSEFLETDNLNLLETNVGIPATRGDNGTFNELTVSNVQTSPAAGSAVAPNGTLDYTLTVSNWGSDPVSNVTVVDNLPAGSRFRNVAAAPLAAGSGGFVCSATGGVVTCSSGALAASPSIGTPTSTTIVIRAFAPPTVNAATTQYTNHAVVDPGNAVAEADETNNASDVGLTVALPSAGGLGAFNELTVDNVQANPAGPAAVAPNGTLDYLLTAKNAGSDPVDNVTVTDYFPAGSRFRNVAVQALVPGGSGGFVCSQASGVLTCTSGHLEAGGTASITVRLYAPDSPNYATNQYTNHVVIDPGATIPEADETNNATDADLTVSVGGANPYNELSVIDSQFFPTADGAVAPGGTLRHLLKVTNSGSDPAMNVPVRDYLPVGTTFRKARLLSSLGGTTAGVTGFVCTQAAGVVDCTNGTIPSGATAVIEVLLFAPSQPSSPGSEPTLTNQVVVDPANVIPEGDETNNTATKDTTVSLGGAGSFWDFTITSSASDTDAKPDALVQYKLDVKNLGSDDAFNVKVSNTLPAGTTFVGAKDSAAGPGDFSCTAAGNVVTCTGGTLLASGATRTIEILAKANHANIVIYDAARVDPDNVLVEADETNNATVAMTGVLSVTNLRTSIVSSGSLAAGDSGTITGHIASDAGSDTAYNVAFELDLPVGITPLDVGFSPLPAGTSCEIFQSPIGKVVCTTPTLAAGADISIVVSVYSNTVDTKTANAIINADGGTVEKPGSSGDNTFQVTV